MESVVNDLEQVSEDGQVWPDGSSVQQEVEEVTSGLKEATDESSLTEKVETLRQSLDDISEEVRGWRGKGLLCRSDRWSQTTSGRHPA